MRSTLIRKGILVENNGVASIELHPQDANMSHLMEEIVEFILDAKVGGKISFAQLYQRLCAPEGQIGLRKGLIPIYLAAVFHEYKKELIIHDRFGQIPLTADTLLQINANPGYFFLSYLEWDQEKEAFVRQMESCFSRQIVSAEKTANSYDYVVSAMRRWYLALPKFAKGAKHTISGERIDKRYIRFLNLLKKTSGSHELLFSELPQVFGYENQFNAGLAENVAAAKCYFDNFIASAKMELADLIKTAFATDDNRNRLHVISLSSVIQDWCEGLNPAVHEQIFADGTEKCLGLFRTITTDEDTFIARLAKATTGLRIEDWDDSTSETFMESLRQCRITAENFHCSADTSMDIPVEGYQISYQDTNGQLVTKRFDHIEISGRANLLLNTIVDEVDSMGRAISEQEKRQVLMEVLKKML